MSKKFSENKKYKVIACVLSRFIKDEQISFMKKTIQEAQKNNCKVIFFSTSTDLYNNDLIDAGEKTVFDVIAVEKYDAIIVLSESFKEDSALQALIKRANTAGIPIFAIDRYMEGCINLAYDYGDCFREIVRHMIGYHGYRTVNFMGGLPGNSFSEERLEVFKDVLAEYNIPYDERRTYYGHFWEIPTVAAMDKMFSDNLPLPEAIICANDAMALTVLNYLHKKNYRVPEDIAVSGFDAIDMEKYSNPRITTGIQDVDAMVRTLFRMISESDYDSCGREVIPVYGRLQIGQSCKCQGEVFANHVTDNMIRLKADMSLLVSYQSVANQMVANYGNVDDMMKLVQELPEYLQLLEYKDIWLCFDETMIDFLDISQRNRKSFPNSAVERMVGCLHYKMKESQGVFDGTHTFPAPQLLPDPNAFWEDNDCCMVTSLHVNGIRLGYTIVNFDVDRFKFMCYESFLTNMRHLLEIQQYQRQVMHFYERDSLTNLYNRNGFYKYVEKLLAEGADEDLSIIFIDMDGLKKINDTYGHAEGDIALQELGRVINQSTGMEITARIGGDEFVVAFKGISTEQSANEIADKIKQGMSAYNQSSKKPYELSASIGVYTAPIQSHDLDYFLKQADREMYTDKTSRGRQRMT